ncbi:O-antigen polymerase [Rhizobium mesosinicum]|uniref:Oligosaccharide repeat unit polymerase n=1 Tax=Rhizobium mesosinicum TaxID=335017 RepID=A0ABS7GNN1_9HYPH|nr:O-antigen polymerase [Rhizobium mesosinicum]MBW9051547.1 oligosaccharide repeat unit polymerase [Rhizobium mesosinicum]
MWTSLVFSVAVALSAVFYFRRIGVSFTISSLLLGLMLVLHGPLYLYYTRVWGPKTKFFEKILSAAPYEDVIATLDVALALSFCCICVGIALSDKVFGVNYQQMREAIGNWSLQTVRVSKGFSERLQIIAAIGVLVLAFFIVIENSIPQVITYFQSDAGEFEKIAMRREFGGSHFYLLNLFNSNLFPFVAFCCFVALRERSIWLRPVALAFIAVVLFEKAATLSKAPLAIFILQLMVIEHLRRSLQVRLSAALGFIVICIVLFGAMTAVAIREISGVGETLDFLFYRVFMIVNESLLEYFAAIPGVLPHSWGSQFSWLVSFLQSESSPPTYLLIGAVHRGVMGSTTTAMFIADAWADFSWAGVLVVSLLAGFFARWLDIELIIKRGKTAATISGLALGHYGVFIMLSTALQTAMVTGGLILVVPLTMAMSCAFKWRPSTQNPGGVENMAHLKQA